MVQFEYGEVFDGGMLWSIYGNGDTIDEALLDYCNKISCRRMVFNASNDKREEITIPELTHTKNIEV